MSVLIIFSTYIGPTSRVCKEETGLEGCKSFNEIDDGLGIDQPDSCR